MRILTENLIRSLKPVPILVAGDIMVDEYIVGDVERISPESPVPILVARDRFQGLGGAGNVVRNLVSMGGNVALVSVVGNDNAGKWFRNHCEKISVESFWLKDDPSRPTTVKTRVVARNQQLVRIDEEHVGQISPELEQAFLSDIKLIMPKVQAVVISDYGKGFLTPKVLNALVSGARDCGVPVLVDPKGMDFSRYQGCSYLTPNLREAAAAAGIEINSKKSLAEAGKILLERTSAKGIVITRGRDGATLVTDEKLQDFPVKPVEIMDVTGAGDTMIAMLALAVANGHPIEDAIVLANLAASIVVARFGAASVTLQEMLDSINNESPESKIIQMDDIVGVLNNHRILGQTIVFTNGCFDLFHAGHLEILRRAAALGDILVVGVNSDASVIRLKGVGRPITPESHRIEIISALNFIDYVVVFEEDTPLKLIQAVRPDILVKGEDWRGKIVVGEDVVRARGGRVEFVTHVPGVSTSQLIKKIREEI
jgi:D-beta-D-heptose 7-phosphate kinase/D-beta-D-heptose 1-phosphate adenosyltransferase